MKTMTTTGCIVQYYGDVTLVGMLAFVEDEDGRLQALGGFDAPDAAAVTTTVVNGEVVLVGCVHPDDIIDGLAEGLVVEEEG